MMYITPPSPPFLSRKPVIDPPSPEEIRARISIMKTLGFRRTYREYMRRIWKGRIKEQNMITWAKFMIDTHYYRKISLTPSGLKFGN